MSARTAGGSRWLLLLISTLASCSSSTPPKGPRCVITNLVGEVALTNVDQFDLLFVISDTPSMAEEQALLAQELPGIVRSLTTGKVDGMQRFPPVEGLPVQDLQIGVVSATFADGGGLHRVPAVGGNGCASEYPGFLRFRGDYYGSQQDDPETFAQSVQCMAELGSASNGPNQALEAALAALSGPTAVPGFLRGDPVKGLSLLAVVVVADTDDCSAASGAQAPSTTAACAAQSDTLQSLDSYVDRLRALRKGNENLVLFGVIGGIPPALTQLGAPPVDLYDTYQRDAFYQRILDDQAMQTVPDPTAPQRLLPACSRGTATAEPARRLTSLAQRFGENGLPSSICNDHWTDPLTLLLSTIAKQLGPVCFPAITRGADGRIPCKVYWDLPPPGLEPAGTPTQCNERPYLTPAPGAPSRTGGQRCEVPQAAISSEAELTAADPNAGFYYDDFSGRVRKACGPVKTEIAFTDSAKPPTGVVVILDCFGLEVASAGDGATPEASVCNVAGSPRVPWVSAESVGRRCMPAVIPDAGFDDRELWIETGAEDCGTGVCMAYHLDGDPRLRCGGGAGNDLYDVLHRCAEPGLVADRLYCTCRCSAPDPSAPTCACPHGFSCRDVLTQGGPAVEGGYCVKDGVAGDSWSSP